ncbi:oligoribonuclease [Thorsellia kenyensis]|uniref:Oligoribonuclease n=1 Tax=Thorsellia kenyensis TaxID=1549888 RepID=A0ABV6CGS5_9GAMM
MKEHTLTDPITKRLDNQNLIWIDLEMTGLNPNQDRIIEIATIVTDKMLNVLAVGPVIAIHQPPEILALMDEWNQKTHGTSGLIKRVQESQISEAEAELETLKFLKQWVPENCSPICGNSIAQDRRFLFNYMPTLEEYFHYRYLDVSTLKELVNRWQPDILKNFTKKATHKALDDILESIEELKFYRTNVMKI